MVYKVCCDLKYISDISNTGYKVTTLKTLLSLYENGLQ